MKKTLHKTVAYYGIAFFVIQALIGLKVFVTFSDMQAYAVSKDQLSLIRDDLKEIKQNQINLSNQVMGILQNK